MQHYSNKEIDAEIAAYFQENPGWERSEAAPEFRQRVRKKMQALSVGSAIRDRSYIRDAIIHVLMVDALRKE